MTTDLRPVDEAHNPDKVAVDPVTTDFAENPETRCVTGCTIAPIRDRDSVSGG
jgi:hypothetical protein